MKNKNLYEILGLRPDATKEEIKISFRKLVRIYHPDINKTKEAETYFKLLNNAVETLLDDTKRLQYDAMAGFSGSQKSGVEKTFEHKTKNAENEQYSTAKNDTENLSRQYFSEQKTNENQQGSEFFKNETLENAENVAFHRTKSTKTRAEGAKIDGKDIETIVKVSESEARQGTARKINVLHTDKCPKCLGRKYFNGMVCALCHGAGEKSEHKIMNVKIPAGIKQGVKIKVKGEGEYGKFGGKNGDLYLVIEIEKGKDAKQDNKNTVIETVISPWQAGLGDEIDVSLGGEIVKMKIPPLTKSMTSFKLNTGGSMSGLKAEYTVVVKIDISKNLSKKELELYEKLRDLDIL